MNISPVQIELALANVIDPDFNKDIISLEMLNDIQIQQDKVVLELLIEPNNSFIKKNKLKQLCINAIHQHVSEGIDVIVNFKDRKLSPSTERNYHSIKGIIAVASGKGGVGKSTVAANVAISLAKEGYKVGLLDADIYGPSIPILFDVNKDELKSIEIDGKSFFLPIEKYGLKLMSVGFFVEDNQALVWRGPMVSNVLKQMIVQTQWGELDYLILDLPPGTGDVQLTLLNLLPIAGVLMVTTPQQLAIADVERALGMFNSKENQIPILGLVENMAYFVPEDEKTGKKYYLFGKTGCKVLAEKVRLKILAEIPLVYFEEENNTLASLAENSISEFVYKELATNILTELEENSNNI